MPTTSNFGWTTPADTDLVKDGAAAIRTLANGVDASFVDLKGGTTNQVLAKNSNTDLDFKWVADATGIPATIFDAKGDIIAATAADTADRLAVGANNTVLTADSSTATGLKWATPASGGYTELASGSLSSTSFTLSSISSSYRDLILVIRNATLDNDSSYYVRLNNDGSSLYRTLDSTTYALNTTVGGVDWQWSGSAVDNRDVDSFAYLRIFDYANTSSVKVAQGYSYFGNTAGTTFNINQTTHYYRSTSAISQIKVSTDGVGYNWTAGTYSLFGVK